MKKSIFAVSGTLLFAVALSTMPSQVLAATQSKSASTKLPFVGTRYFNFDGGTGTERSMTIAKKWSDNHQIAWSVFYRDNLSG